MPLPTGKLPYDELRRLLSIIHHPNGSVLLGPGIGEDAALIDMGDKLLVVHADPITGAVEEIGWLSVNVSANDVATRGARPRWLVSVILLQEGAGPEVVESIARQIRDAADAIGAVVVGGHTEVTPRLDRPIVVTTAFGLVDKEKAVFTANAKPGDALILTKGAGIEGTAIIAGEFKSLLQDRVPEEVLKNARGFIREISVVREATAAVEAGGVHAMHDATEGGVLGAVQEMTVAANLSARIYEEMIPLREETRVICAALGIDPLRLISSGSLLIAARRDSASQVVEKIREAGVEASIIGSLEEGEGVTLVRRDGKQVRITEPVTDELWRLYSRVI